MPRGNQIRPARRRQPSRPRASRCGDSLFDASPLGKLELDAEDAIVRANPALGAMLGARPKALVCKDFTGFVASDSLEDFRAFRVRRRDSAELQLQSAAGEPIPARLSMIQSLARGRVLLAVSDLRELEEARTRLNEQERELRAARRQLERSGRREHDYLEIADVIMVGLNTAGEITLLNRRGCELLGYEEHEALRRNWYELVSRGDERREAFQRAIAENQPLPEFVTGTVRTRDGQERQIRWHNMTLRDAHGRIEGTLSSGVDITEQLRTEQRLQRSQAALVNTRQKLDLYESMMVAVVENAADAVLTISPEGLIQTVNRAALRMFGYAEHELVGKHASVLLPPPAHPQHDGKLAGALRDDLGQLVGDGRETFATRSTGENFPVHLSVGDISDSATRVYTGVLRDLTREKQLQKKLQEQEALASLGRMAAVVAHEVRNPLAGISGVIQVFRDRLAPDSPERGVLGEVLSRIDALVETIQELLLYARPRELRPAPVALAELLAQTARLVAEDPRFSAVDVRVTDAGLTLRLDADYFREALLNLMINAAQAMNGNGVIRVTVETLDGLARIRVADNGPGIAPEIREKVFDAFFTTKGRGTGLGLALVKSVVERHGGQVGIECPESGGTVVTLTLPDTGATAQTLSRG